MSDEAAITVLLAQAKAMVGAVGKDGYNKTQSYNFRGIDGVLNAVGPAFGKLGVVVMPRRQNLTLSTVEVGTKRTLMAHAVVTVQYHFYGPGGDSVWCEVDGEAMDSGDKCVSKAYSVAYRIALLQALSIPTHEPDPDESTYTRSDAPQAPVLPDGHMSRHDAKRRILEVVGGDRDEAAKVWELHWPGNPESVKAVEVEDAVALFAPFDDPEPEGDSDGK